jgi:hypothetical protein
VWSPEGWNSVRTVPSYTTSSFQGFTAAKARPVATPFFWSWYVYTEDDPGTEYEDNNSGAFDRFTGGAASHGERDLGPVPTTARSLTLSFEPAAAWDAPEP